jgi:hypothetical protein
LVDLDDKTTKYEISSIHTTECDKNIEDEFGKGIKVRTLDEAIGLGKTYRSVYIIWGNSNPPVNPSKLFEYNYRILKVKIRKSDLIIPSNKLAISRTGRIEIVEEVKLEHKIKYETKSIVKNINGYYEFLITVINETNNESIPVNFTATNVDIEIKYKIQSQLKEMQEIYDAYTKNNGTLNINEDDLYRN